MIICFVWQRYVEVFHNGYDRLDAMLLWHEPMPQTCFAAEERRRGRWIPGFVGSQHFSFLNFALVSEFGVAVPESMEALTGVG